MLIFALIISILSSIFYGLINSSKNPLKNIRVRIIFLALTFGLLAGYVLSHSVTLIMDPNLYPNEFLIAQQKRLFPKNENAYLVGWGIQISASIVFTSWNLKQAANFEMGNLNERYFLLV